MATVNDWSTIQFNLPTVSQAHAIAQAPLDDLIEYRQARSVTGDVALQSIGRQACTPIFEAIRPSMRALTTELQLAVSRNQQIVHYRNIVSHLNALQEEYANLLRNCWLKVAFSGAVFFNDVTERRSRSEEERWIEEGLAHRAFQRSTFRSIVTARFVSENDGNLLSALVDDTQRLARDFVRVCVQRLLDLVGEMSVGVAQWYPGNNCRYIFFRRQVMSRYEARASGVGQVTGVTLDAIECHDHHLINAYLCDPGNSPVPIPQPVAELIATIPQWIRPHVRLIVGTLVQENVNQKVVKTEGWPLDPALTIGDFVLTGWSPSDSIARGATRSMLPGDDLFADR